jgi:hypothetical protein
LSLYYSGTFLKFFFNKPLKKITGFPAAKRKMARTLQMQAMVHQYFDSGKNLSEFFDAVKSKNASGFFPSPLFPS